MILPWNDRCFYFTLHCHSIAGQEHDLTSNTDVCVYHHKAGNMIALKPTERQIKDRSNKRMMNVPPPAPVTDLQTNLNDTLRLKNRIHLWNEQKLQK